MKNNTTNIVCILDRTRSTAPVQVATAAAFNQFINQLRSQQGDCNVKLIQLGDKYETAFDLPLNLVQKISSESYTPKASTRLLDGLGRTTDQTGEELAAQPQDKRPGNVIILTVTDATENASKNYTHGQVAEMIAHQQANYAWKYVFLGANQDAIKTASGLNIPKQNALTYDTNEQSIGHAFMAAANLINLIRSNQEQDQGPSFTEDDRQASMGNASKPMSEQGKVTANA